jgi:hypothetical protein
MTMHADAFEPTPSQADDFEPAPSQAEHSVDALGHVLASLPPDAVLSHRSAALVWGLWIADFDAIEVTSPAGERGSRYTTSVQRCTVIAHRRVLPPRHVTSRFGLPVTTLARTWLDLAPLCDVHDLVAAGDSALRAGADMAEIGQLVAGARRLRGLARARMAAPILDGRSRSRPESRIRSALVLAGLPRPRVNEAITDVHHGWLAEPDLHYREARLALEYNGADHATVPRMRKDSTRLLDLQRADWEVRTYTAAQVFRRLDDVVSDVRGLLRRRAPELLASTALDRRVTYLQDQRRRNRRL